MLLAAFFIIFAVAVLTVPALAQEERPELEPLQAITADFFNNISEKAYIWSLNEDGHAILNNDGDVFLGDARLETAGTLEAGSLTLGGKTVTSALATSAELAAQMDTLGPLAVLDCTEDGHIATYSAINGWECATPIDTTLTEAQVDDFVQNNGYLTQEADPTVPAEIKDGISWEEIANIPADIADGDANTTYDLSPYVITEDLGSLASKNSIESADITDGTIESEDIASVDFAKVTGLSGLAGLTCENAEEFAMYSGTEWVCGTVEQTWDALSGIPAYIAELAGSTLAENSFLFRENNEFAPKSATQTREILEISNVNNTADADKPISNATQTALDAKIGKNDDLDAQNIVGMLDIGNVPRAALADLYYVTDEAARYTLTTTQVQKGDTVHQADTNTLFLVKDEANLGNANGYQEYTAATAWETIDNKPDDFFYRNTHNTDNIDEGQVNLFMQASEKETIAQAMRKDNADDFTPTLDTHPATKGYVDNLLQISETFWADIKNIPQNIARLASGVFVDQDFVVYSGGEMLGKTAAQVKVMLGLENVDNTPDAAKPVSQATQSLLDAKQNITDTIEASRITGTLDVARLPATSLERLYSVADAAGRFALTTTEVQNGDTVRQVDTDSLYIVTDDSNLGGEEGYQIYTAPTVWSTIQQKPADIFLFNTHTAEHLQEGSTKLLLTAQERINIAQNTSQTSDNKADISKNSIDILGNADNILENSNNISGNTGDIAKNTSAISVNTADIADNASGIFDNLLSASSNYNSILENDTDIAANSTNINANAEAVEANAASIETLEGSVYSKQEVDNKIITTTSGDGNQFLADDGEYKEIATGGGGGMNPYIPSNENHDIEVNLVDDKSATVFLSGEYFHHDNQIDNLPEGILQSTSHATPASAQLTLTGSNTEVPRTELSFSGHENWDNAISIAASSHTSTELLGSTSVEAGKYYRISRNTPLGSGYVNNYYGTDYTDAIYKAKYNFNASSNDIRNNYANFEQTLFSPRSFPAPQNFSWSFGTPTVESQMYGFDNPRNLEIYRENGQVYGVLFDYNGYIHILNLTDPKKPWLVAKHEDRINLIYTQKGRIFEDNGQRYAAIIITGRDKMVIANITDPMNIFVEDVYISEHNIDGPIDLTIVEHGSRRFAIVSAMTDKEITSLEITNPKNITYRHSYGSSTYFSTTRAVRSFWSGGKAYVITSSDAANGYLVTLEVTSTGTLSYKHATTHIDASYSHDLEVFYDGSTPYAAVASRQADGKISLFWLNGGNINYRRSISSSNMQYTQVVGFMTKNERTYLISAARDKNILAITDASDANLVNKDYFYENATIDTGSGGGFRLYEQDNILYGIVASTQSDTLSIIRFSR